MYQLADEEEHNFPIAAKIIKRDFYIDDLISGGQSVQEVKSILLKVKSLLENGNLILKCSLNALYFLQLLACMILWV